MFGFKNFVLRERSIFIWFSKQDPSFNLSNSRATCSISMSECVVALFFIRNSERWNELLNLEFNNIAVSYISNTTSSPWTLGKPSGSQSFAEMSKNYLHGGMYIPSNCNSVNIYFSFFLSFMIGNFLTGFSKYFFFHVVLWWNYRSHIW